MKTKKIRVFKNPTRITKIVKFLNYGCLLGAIVSIVFSVFNLDLVFDFYKDVPIDITSIENGWAWGVFGILKSVILSGYLITFMVWVYRMNSNSWALGSTMRFTPGMVSNLVLYSYCLSLEALPSH